MFGLPVRRACLRLGHHRWASSASHSRLIPPTVLYSDNHLLVVNKPVGWHSVPNPQPSPKCLLSELKRQKLGGGSGKDFLLPIHRIDQPCSGVLLLGKTSKAGSRVSKLWKKRKVRKTYLCVVSASHRSRLQQSSRESENGMWRSLQGYMQPRTSKKSRSVVVSTVSSGSGRPISVEWRTIKCSIGDDYSLLQVRTNEGARHQVRALLSQVGGCPIQGDVRYGGNLQVPLPDHSVALHAYSISLNGLQLGSLSVFDFQAPVPAMWDQYFGIRDLEVPLQ